LIISLIVYAWKAFPNNAVEFLPITIKGERLREMHYANRLVGRRCPIDEN